MTGSPTPEFFFIWPQHGALPVAARRACLGPQCAARLFSQSPRLGLSSHLWCVTQTLGSPASSATGANCNEPHQWLEPSPPTHHQRAHQTGMLSLQPREGHCRGRGTQKDLSEVRGEGADRKERGSQGP